MGLFYEDDLVTLFHGDCREELAWLNADVLVTDPPYGVAFSEKRTKRQKVGAIIGDDSTDTRDMAVGLWREQQGGVNKPALLFGHYRIPRPVDTRHVLIWSKGNNTGLGDTSLPWGVSYEEIYVMGRGFKGSREPNIITCPTIPSSHWLRQRHPAPKPVPLIERLLSKCPPEWVVADPFAGSGATVIAARNLGRRVVAVELEERYCELIVERIQNTPVGLFDEFEE